jgi:hypothetical protein
VLNFHKMLFVIGATASVLPVWLASRWNIGHSSLDWVCAKTTVGARISKRSVKQIIALLTLSTHKEMVLND